MKFDFNFFDGLFTILGRVEQVQVAPGTVDNPLAVGGGVAYVIIFVVSVALDVLAVEGAGIKVADTFVVRKIINPLAQPERANDMARVFEQRLKFTLALIIKPDFSGSGRRDNVSS
ncbi:MAG: hypothetical protein HC875_32450 [Anaerolineales bacterium]|nr:hypothetical protein [Anaerolineales bacterium]